MVVSEKVQLALAHVKCWSNSFSAQILAKKVSACEIKPHTDKKKRKANISYRQVATMVFKYVVTTDQLARTQENKITYVGRNIKPKGNKDISGIQLQVHNAVWLISVNYLI